MTGLAILLVEQNTKQSLNIADRGSLIETGRIVGEGTPAALKTDPGGAARLSWCGGCARGGTGA